MRLTSRILCGILILIITLPVMAGHTNASSITVTVYNNSVSVSASLELIENLTSLPSLPSLYLGVSNSSVANVTMPMQSAMDRLVPTARIQQFQLHARTLETVPRLNMWSLRVDYTMTVVGVNSESGTIVLSNLAFLRMNVSDSMIESGFQLNNIGRVYLLHALLSFGNIRTIYFDSGHEFLNSVIPGNDTLAFNIFDFTWLPPLSAWSHTDAPLDTTSRWTYVPATQPYNVTVGKVTPENTLVPVYTAFYVPSVEVDGPARASASSSTVSFNMAIIDEAVMSAVTLASLAIFLVVLLLDRRLTRRVALRRKRQSG